MRVYIIAECGLGWLASEEAYTNVHAAREAVAELRRDGSPQSYSIRELDLRMPWDFQIVELPREATAEDLGL